jgi:hypothetical protein
MTDNYATVGESRENTLAENYTKHDIAEQWVTGKLKRHGFTVEKLGIDKRHDMDAESSVCPDLRVSSNGNLCGYIEPKSKSVEYPQWFGRLNYRHFKEYLNFIENEDVPLLLYFAIVDEDGMEPKVLREDFIAVYSMDQIVETMVPQSNPNKVVQLDEDDYRSWPWVFGQLQ